MVTRDPRVNQDLRDLKALQVQLVPWVQLEEQGTLASLELPGQQAVRDHQGPQDRTAHREAQELLVFRVRRVLKDHLVLKVIKGQQDRRVLKVQLAPLDPKALQEILVSRVIRELKDSLDL